MQEDEEPSPLFLRYSALNWILVGSGEHPSDGSAAAAVPWWAQESILLTDTLLFPRRLPCNAPPARERAAREAGLN